MKWKTVVVVTGLAIGLLSIIPSWAEDTRDMLDAWSARVEYQLEACEYPSADAMVEAVANETLTLTVHMLRNDVPENFMRYFEYELQRIELAMQKCGRKLYFKNEKAGEQK